MIYQDLHTHSLFDDGNNTLEEMVQGAIAAGLTSIGFSGHSPFNVSSDWGIAPENLEKYNEEAKSLQEKYRGKITIFRGIEYDITTTHKLSDFDYVIGSIHFLEINDKAYSIDYKVEVTRDIINRLFKGDSDEAARVYYSQYERVAENPEIDIVGHFDLITKFEERVGLFKENSSVYKKSALEAMEKLVVAGKIFEINTGAISRGYRSLPYPSAFLLEALQAMGGKITITSDAHRSKDIACKFSLAEDIAKNCGFKELWQLQQEGFVPIEL